MTRGQLARLPAAEGRRAERRLVNLAAGLREPGAAIVDCDVLNLSTDGFMAISEMALQEGQFVWLKLPGLEVQKSQVVWIDGDKAGFCFMTPLHQIELSQLSEAQRKPVPRGHFGPQVWR